MYIDRKSQQVSYLRQLVDSEGWKMIERIVEDNIKFLEKRLFEGVDCDTLEKVADVRNRIAIHKEVIAIPRAIIKNHDTPEPKEENMDPFE